MLPGWHSGKNFVRLPPLAYLRFETAPVLSPVDVTTLGNEE
jgi:hypothetical protein